MNAPEGMISDTNILNVVFEEALVPTPSILWTSCS